MNIKEARIGNLFIGFDNKQFEFLPEHYFLIGEGYDIDEIIKAPIELIKEHLIKFGFKKVVIKMTIDYIYYEYKNFRVFIINNGFEIEMQVLGEWFNFGVIYTHVHQLQNVIHSLTGEELTLKE